MPLDKNDTYSASLCIQNAGKWTTCSMCSSCATLVMSPLVINFNHSKQLVPIQHS